MITDSVKVPESEVEPYKYNWEDGLLVLMDCGGSNAVKVNEQLKEANPKFPGVRIIATGRGPNHPECKARQRKEEMKVPLAEVDFRKEEERFGIAKGDYFKAVTYGSDAKLRGELNYLAVIDARDKISRKFLRKIHEKMSEHKIPRNIPTFAAGFMQLLSLYATTALNMENVHPGDVTKYSLDGVMRDKRIIVGDAWIPPAKAISAGHEILYSSMHKLIHEMDAGPVYMRGYGLPIDYNCLLSKVDIFDKKVLKQVAGAAQETLKYIGDHVIAGATFQDLFEGNWGKHEPTGKMAYRFDGEWYLAPNGIMVEDHVANNPQTVFQRDKDFLEEKIKDFYSAVDKISKGEVE